MQHWAECTKRPRGMPRYPTADAHEMPDAFAVCSFCSGVCSVSVLLNLYFEKRTRRQLREACVDSTECPR